MKEIKNLIRKVQDQDSRNIRGRVNQLKKILDILDNNIKEIEESLPAPIVTSDITSLTPDQCASLKGGDVVIKTTGTERHTYVVTYKDDTKGELLLTYTDWQNIEGVYYDKTGGDWAYVQTDNTSKYVLPTASAETLGGVKIGSGISITEEGVISASGGSEPMIVEGEINYSYGDAPSFSPYSGQPTFDQAHAAFAAGTPVFLSFEDVGKPILIKIIAYIKDETRDRVETLSGMGKEGDMAGSYGLHCYDWYKSLQNEE